MSLAPASVAPLRVLWVDDSDEALPRLREALPDLARRLERVDEASGLRQALAERNVGVVLARWTSARLAGREALRLARLPENDAPLVVVLDQGDDAASALEAIAAGADDFVRIDELARLGDVIALAQVRWARARATSVGDGDAVDRLVEANEVLRAVVVDLRGRARTHEALRKSEERFRRIVTTTMEGVWTLDAHLATDFVNTRMAAMLGYTPEEMIGMPAIDFVEPANRDNAEQRIEERRKGVAGSSELQLRRKDGSWVWVRMESQPMFGPSGELEGALAVVTDLTERRRAERALEETEAQLRHAQKMEAVGRLAGGIAHDFNNLLSAVLAYSEVAMEALEPSHPVRDDIAQIHVAGERAAALTRQLLMFSRRQVLEPRSLDPSEVLESMDKMLRRVLGEHIELVALPGPTVGCIRADRSSLEQVLMNLAVNARDAMPDGGRLTIATASVVLDEEFARSHVGVAPGAYVSMSVTDTGTGMDAETRAHVFEPFFTTKPVGRGTGLGLSTVFGIVQQSSGTIWVESEVGVGTTFTAYFPLVEAATAPPPIVRTTGKTEGTEAILLVEDNDQVRAVAMDILRRHGYRVIEARSPGEAILICEDPREAIDLLLTDVVMPQLSGPALARRLVALRPTLKVLCMSGYTDDETIRHGVVDADVAYLAKPFTSESLTRKVRDVLDAIAAPAPS